MSKKIKTKNPNMDSEMKKLLIILLVIIVVGVAAYVGIHEYAKFKDDLSGEFQTIVDITAPSITATLSDITDAEIGKTKLVSFTISDQAGGSGLYGLCITIEPDVDTLVETDNECFDTFLLESNISVNLDVTMPIEDGVSTTYYAYAKDNFGNISNGYSFAVE